MGLVEAALVSIGNDRGNFHYITAYYCPFVFSVLCILVPMTLCFAKHFLLNFALKFERVSEFASDNSKYRNCQQLPPP